ncbi:hypothetical protein ACWDR0_08845 [Streptomyces sp. NPDC003691]
MPMLPEDLVDLIHDLRRRLDRVSLAAGTRPALTAATGPAAAAAGTSGGAPALPDTPIPLHPAPAPVTSAGWTRVLQSSVHLPYPRIAVGLRVEAGPGTTVEALVRVLAADGTTVSSSPVVTAAGAAVTQEVIFVPGGATEARSTLCVEGRVTAGGAGAAVGVLYAEGLPS